MGKSSYVISINDSDWAYYPRKLLGCGTYGKVYECINSRTGVNAAVKIVKCTDNGKNVPYEEIEILKQMDHPNVVKLIDVRTGKNDEGDDIIYIIMELIKGGDLLGHVSLGRFSEDKARNVFKQLVQALRYLHSKRIVHRDIKLENILVHDVDLMLIKLIDFGFAYQLKEEVFLESYCGSYYYIAPELLYKYPYDGMKADIWSLGVILYSLTTGNLPFGQYDELCPEFINALVNGNYELPSYLSPALRDLISQMMCINPQKRITIDSIINHEWMKLLPPPNGIFRKFLSKHKFKTYHLNTDSKLFKSSRKTLSCVFSDSITPFFSSPLITY